MCSVLTNSFRSLSRDILRLNNERETKKFIPPIIQFYSKSGKKRARLCKRLSRSLDQASLFPDERSKTLSRKMKMIRLLLPSASRSGKNIGDAGKFYARTIRCRYSSNWPKKHLMTKTKTSYFRQRLSVKA